MNPVVFIKSNLLVFFCFSVFGLMTACAQSPQLVDNVVQKQINDKKIVGVGVAVVRDGKLLTLKGFGYENIENKTLATENTLFEIGSLTKQFTAAGVMLLVEENKIKLDEAVGKYLPALPEKWRGVTVRQLLNQTSGIKNYTAVEPPLDPNREYKPEEIISRVADHPLEFASGTKWAYSNTNYYLLGLLIEKTSGASYAQFMRQRIFEPLKMTATFVNEKGLTMKNRANGYEIGKENFQAAAQTDPSLPFAAGAIISTVADSIKWDAVLTNEKLLKRRSLDEIFTAGKLADGNKTRYGMGWMISKIGGIDLTSHNGSTIGFNSNITRFPGEKLTVIVLLNSSGTQAEKLAFEIAGLYLPAVAANLAERSQPTEKIADTDEAMTKFLRETLEKLAAGEDVKNRFTADAQFLLLPDEVKVLKNLLDKSGSIKSFDLLADDNLPKSRRRIHLVTFANAVMRFTFFISADGKINGMTFKPEQ